MKICYREINLSDGSLRLVETANQIIEEYRKQGFDLTLRQLYYQFVARAIIENRQSEYKRLGSIINDARLCGLISWEAIVDRTRELRENSHWESPRDIVEACAKGYQIDKWADQEHRVEVWIEKDALVGVLESICPKLDVSYFSCRGYTSQSEMWEAGQRLLRHTEAGQTPVILHLGDHDPSGIDMSRDIEDRLNLFMRGEPIIFERIALNMDQVKRHNPPPNPAKLTDSRCRGYIKVHGSKSWELDALDPRTLEKLIRAKVSAYRDDEKFEEKISEEAIHRETLLKAAKRMTA